MIKKFLIPLTFSLLLLSALPADETPESTKGSTEAPKAVLKEESTETTHTVTIRGQPISYKARAGVLPLKDNQDKTKAGIFYIAYTKEGVEDIASRPVTFCFNGGPGSSAIWLHLGVFGPKRIILNENECAAPPFQLTDNESSILDVTDLVFIDPVSTGYSKVSPGEDPKKFHGVEEDINSVGEFIRLYTTRNNRWTSPKFLAGESYGTTRAAGLVGHLQDNLHMPFQGIVLVSSILNFQTMLDPTHGNDLPYILLLPSFTAAAWYHEKLPSDLQQGPLSAALAEAELFAKNEYTLALMKGDSLTGPERDKVVQKLARYTGLKPIYLQRANLRVGTLCFAKELLRDDNLTIGRFDSRITGTDRDKCGSSIENDPSMDSLLGGFSAAFNYYLRNDLKIEKDEPYRVITDVHPWDYSRWASNQYLNVADSLRDSMTRNPFLKVFVASGYYDLATPFFATDYTFQHLGLDPSLQSHIKMEYYAGGHMMYTSPKSLAKLTQDLANFIRTACQYPKITAKD